MCLYSVVCLADVQSSSSSSKPFRRRHLYKMSFALTKVFSFWLDSFSLLPLKLNKRRHLNENEFWFVLYSRPYQDGSLVFEVRLGDVMDLICPFYDEQQSYMTSELEQYDIYRVGFPFFSLSYLWSQADAYLFHFRSPKKNTATVWSPLIQVTRSLVVSSAVIARTMWWNIHWTSVPTYRFPTGWNFVPIRLITSFPPQPVIHRVANFKFLYMTIVSSEEVFCLDALIDH